MTDTPQRLFLALWPSDEVRNQLALARKALSKTGVRGRPIPDQNLHLTLMFLGDVTSSQRNDLETSLDNLSAEAFSLVFDRYGYWPRPRIQWLGCSQVSTELVSLVNILYIITGRPREARPYEPHITLFRKASRVSAYPQLNPVEWRCDAVSLVRSQLNIGGAEYEVVRRWVLQ